MFRQFQFLLDHILYIECMNSKDFFPRSTNLQCRVNSLHTADNPFAILE